jgi:ABC-type Fe3+/spermidine/putrescine transport system ATPase subunit
VLAIEVKNVSKRFEDLLVFRNLSISAGVAECIALTGPSGCGKTTLLRIVAGLDTLDQGEVHLFGRLVSDNTTHVPPMDRNLNMVFQDFALWPHMTVEKHLQFVLKAQRVAQRERQIRIENILSVCDLRDKAANYPSELSGGQQQRVGIARALVTMPRLLLLDEPFSNLSVELRERIIDELLRRKRSESLTLLVATHNASELGALVDSTHSM